MFKVGDEVFVKGSIVEIENDEYDAYPVAVGFDKGRSEWYAEEELIPVGKTYEQGIADAWELAKKVYNMKIADIDEIFGVNGGFYEVMRDFSIEEALAKISEYEREKEIKVGDEVVHGCEGLETKFFVTYIDYHSIKGIEKNGDTHFFTFPNQYIKKSGKHIDIESLLKEIGE